MDTGGFSCMQSQQTSVSDHGCYNKSTCEIMRLQGSRPHPLSACQSSINRPSPLMKKRAVADLGIQKDTHPLHSYSSCKLKNYSETSPPLRDFFQLRVFMQILCVSLLCAVFYLHTLSHFHFLLVVRIGHPITCGRTSPPHKYRVP